VTTLATDARNAACDAVVDLVDAGSGAGKLEIGTTGFASVLATVALADPAFGAAATGVATGASFPRSDSSADASGTAAEWRVRDSDDNTVMSGTVSLSGGGGELILDSLSITVGQTVTISSFTHTQPAS
jgi:hypothetical protein